MMVQWCIKGLSLDDDAAAEQIITDQRGLLCQWWLNSNTIPPLEEIPAKLTLGNLLQHVNQFVGIDPSTGQPFNLASPFISLSAGTIERDVLLATNTVHTARRTAIHFGSKFGAADVAYTVICGPSPAQRYVDSTADVCQPRLGAHSRRTRQRSEIRCGG